MSVPDPSSPPVPSWAISMAVEHANELSDGNAITLARLLASVREGALREASRVSGAVCGCVECPNTILSLLSTPPREG